MYFRGIEFTNVQHHPTGVVAAKISYKGKLGLGYGIMLGVFLVDCLEDRLIAQL